MYSCSWKQGAIFVSFFKRSLTRGQFFIFVCSSIRNQTVLQALHELKEIFKVDLTIILIRRGLKVKTLDKVDSFSWISAKRAHDSLQVCDINETSFFFVKHLEDTFEVFYFLLRILLEDIGSIWTTTLFY